MDVLIKGTFHVVCSWLVVPNFKNTAVEMDIKPLSFISSNPIRPPVKRVLFQKTTSKKLVDWRGEWMLKI